jgi:uncharacterized protein YndB with AHSA1/START domain
VSTSSYEITVRSAASPQAVFDLLADASGWPRWAGPLIARASWEREGDPPPGGVGAIRKFGRWPQTSREQIVAYDPPHHLAYRVLSGVPVRDYRADIDIAPEGAGTMLRWRATFTPKIPGTGALFARVLRAIVGGFARRAAKFAVGEPGI